MNKFVFFTFSNFNIDGGGRVRIYGILNSLAKISNTEIILISNCDDKSKFHKSIKHINMDLTISSREKKLFQFCLAIFPNFINKFLFSHALKEFNKKVNIEYRNKIIFFEYLDNSFGYFLKKNDLIKHYINDIHGIAPLEFAYNRVSVVKNIFNILRYKVAMILDQKVMKNATKIIVVSEAMKEYFVNEYPYLEDKILLVRDGVSKTFCSQNIDEDLLRKITKMYKSDGMKIIFFAGNFKDLGGVLDLVSAFIELAKVRKDIKLFLIGDGEHFEKAKKNVKDAKVDNLVSFLGRVAYSKLKTYQQIADIIVCPDKQHPYSELVPHIKYFDSLVSNKVVINGKFKTIQEINKNQALSIDFEPSNIDDLMNKIEYVLVNLSELSDKYKQNSKRVCQDYTYESNVQGLL